MHSYVGECQFNSFLVLNHRIHIRGDQVDKNEMGGTCSRYGVEERCIQGSGGET
jgi:hypothetical protein